VDNFLRPYFMQGQSGMSTIVLFFALIGGIKLYGPMGLIYGPVIFSICAVVLYIFRIENREALRNLANH
jgi:predicted PurR-regulated permease PerM